MSGLYCADCGDDFYTDQDYYDHYGAYHTGRPYHPSPYAASGTIDRSRRRSIKKKSGTVEVEYDIHIKYRKKVNVDSEDKNGRDRASSPTRQLGMLSLKDSRRPSESKRRELEPSRPLSRYDAPTHGRSQLEPARIDYPTTKDPYGDIGAVSRRDFAPSPQELSRSRSYSSPSTARLPRDARATGNVPSAIPEDSMLAPSPRGDVYGTYRSAAGPRQLESYGQDPDPRSSSRSQRAGYVTNRSGSGSLNGGPRYDGGYDGRSKYDGRSMRGL
ncbi:MAG: hypothetical protein Q9190_002342 [Brigantiaea leucoxantha]